MSIRQALEEMGVSKVDISYIEKRYEDGKLLDNYLIYMLVNKYGWSYTIDYVDKYVNFYKFDKVYKFNMQNMLIDWESIEKVW